MCVRRAAQPRELLALMQAEQIIPAAEPGEGAQGPASPAELKERKRKCDNLIIDEATRHANLDAAARNALPM